MFWIFRKKPPVEKYEEEFRPEEMKKRIVYYDVSFRVGDPERVRAFLSRLFEEFDYKVIVNKLTKFEELEEEIFLGGRLKPVRGVIKGRKKLDLGMKYPGRVILAGFFAVLFFLASFWRNWDPFLLKLSLILAVVTFFFLLFRKGVYLNVWAKIAGIYDPSKEQADLKLTLAGDIEKYDKRAEEVLQSDMNSMFVTISDRYLRRRPEEEEYYVIKEGKKPWEIEETKKDEIIKMITMLRKDISALDSRFARGEITKEDYEELRKRLQERLEKYETVLEFFT